MALTRYATLQVALLVTMVNVMTPVLSVGECTIRNCTTQTDEQTDNLVYNCPNAGCTAFPFDDYLDIDVQAIDLSHNILRDVPELEFRELETLNLAYNLISSVHDNAFAKCQSLRRLNLTGNRLVEISGEALDFAGNLEYVYLNGNQLRKLNDTNLFFFTKKLKVIELQNNSLEFISPDVFYHFDKIETIRLSYNKFPSLHRDTFLGLWGLQFLFLDNNKLTNVSDDAFTTQGNLISLDLRHNLLTELSHNIFDPLDRLQVLHLSYNPLQAVQEGLFADPPELEDIYLDNTEIKTVAAKAFPASLKKITLSNTDFLSEIVNGTFTGLRSLTKITIQGNPKLRKIEPGAFDGRNSSVREVLLADNALSSLSEDLLDWSQVTRFDLTGNPWDCSADVAWMLDAVPRDHLELMKCATPLVHKGKKFTDLKAADLSSNFIYQHRYEGAIALSVIVSLAFVGILAFVGYRYRRTLWFPKDQNYQTLYEVDEGDDEEVNSVTFSKNSVSNDKVGMRLAGAEVNGVTPTAV